MLERLADDPEQLGALERLGQEVDGAILHRLDGFLDRAERRQQDHVHVGRHGLDLPQELEPGETGHLEVRQHEVDAAGAEPLEGGGAVGGQDHGVPLAGQHALEALAHGRIVVGDEEGRGDGRAGGLAHAVFSGRLTGRWTVKVAPEPGSLAQRSSPPCSSTIWREM